MREIEVKYRLEYLPSRRWLRGLVRAWGGDLREAHRIRYRDVYWDTPDRLLWREGMALRLRLMPHPRWTLKGHERRRGKGVERMEVEMPVRWREVRRFQQGPDLDQLPEVIRRRIPRRAGPLETVVDVMGEREVWVLLREGRRGELMVEEVWRGGVRGVFLEYEGEPEDVRSFAGFFSRMTGREPYPYAKLIWALFHVPTES